MQNIVIAALILVLLIFCFRPIFWLITGRRINPNALIDVIDCYVAGDLSLRIVLGRNSLLHEYPVSIELDSYVGSDDKNFTKYIISGVPKINPKSGLAYVETTLPLTFKNILSHDIKCKAWVVSATFPNNCQVNFLVEEDESYAKK
jgi:hypothetical protein